MDKFVQQEPKRARVNDSIANSTYFITVPVEVSLDAPSGTIDIVSPVNLKKSYSYQNHWEEKYKWLLYIEEKNYVLCKYCKWFSKSGKKFNSKFAKTTFTLDGYSNWRKALVKLAIHEGSEMHKESVFAHAVFLGQNQGIDAVLLSKI